MLSKAAYRHLSRMTSMLQLQTFLAQHKPKPRKGVKAARQRRSKKWLEQRVAMAELRTEVFHRAQGVCELCQYNEPSELHHLEGGSGRRRQLQSAENCMAVCMRCHRGYHDKPESYRGNVEEWVMQHDYPLPSRFSIPEKQAAR